MEKLGQEPFPYSTANSPRSIHDFAVMFAHLQALKILKGLAFMDRDVFLLQGEMNPANVPPRSFSQMPVQPLTPWTLPRLAAAGFAWLMAETSPALPAPVTANKHRV